jgi:hypothetical protein
MKPREALEINDKAKLFTTTRDISRERQIYNFEGMSSLTELSALDLTQTLFKKVVEADPTVETGTVIHSILQDYCIRKVQSVR